MNLHTAQISGHVAPGAAAVLVLDGAGWRRPGGKLLIPDNIIPPHLPPYTPELNPAENVWRLLRENHVSEHVRES